MEKNEELELEIIDSGLNMEGIARNEGQVVFIPYGIIGEKVSSKIIKVKKNFAIAKIQNILYESKYRVKPACDVYYKCGGCQSLHIDYDFSLILKKESIKNAMKKHNICDVKIDNTIGMGMPYYYRNKAQYPVVQENGVNKIGFFANRTHEVVENKCCYIQNRIIDMLSKEVFEELVGQGFTGYNEVLGNGDIRNIIIRRGYHTKEIMIVIVAGNKGIYKDSRFLKVATNMMNKNNNIKSVFVNLNDENVNKIMGDKQYLVKGEKYIAETLGEYEFVISPKSFFQVNTIQAELLYHTLQNLLDLKGNEILFDLYSGVGSIGIFLSKHVKGVYGIEIQEEAVKMANINILKNSVENAEYIAGSVEDKIEEFKNRKIIPDVVVVDPPRKGLDSKTIDYIIDFNPTKIGYVSCNPATLARDLKVFEEKYTIEHITPIDMFCHTAHVECVVVLGRKKNLEN